MRLSLPIAHTRHGGAFVKFLAVIVVIAIVVVVLPMFKAGRDDFIRPDNSENKMKAIAVALVRYEATYNVFPAAYTVDKNGKPLLSWRVLILPYLGHDALYKEFHLDEPWNSEHNNRLVYRMPKAYKSLESNVASDGKTNFLTAHGEQTVFPGKKGISLSEISNAFTKTITAVEVSDEKAVTWTQPDDLQLNESDPLNGVVGLHRGCFVAAFVDGHVDIVPETINPQAVKAMFSRNGKDE